MIEGGRKKHKKLDLMVKGKNSFELGDYLNDLVRLYSIKCSKIFDIQ